MPSPTTLLEAIRGYRISQCIYIAAKLGIADLLKDGEQHCDVLATVTNTNKDAIYRLLRALASVGIFAETQPHYFQLTPLAAYLQSDVPNSLKAYAIMLGEEHYQAWGSIMYSIQTGENAFENLYGMNFYEFFKQNSASAKTFDQAMTDLSGVVNVSILAAYNFSSIGKLVDVGGGNGKLLSSILEAYPTMTGVLFDQPDVIDRASDLLKTIGLSNSLQLAKGDFFKTVPVGGDAYMLKHIIHNWGDEEAIAILQNCYQAMRDRGVLLLMEIVIPPGNEPCTGKFMDINMLTICPGGRERTETEYRNLLKKAGFKLTKIVPTESEISIIEAVKNQI
ncbi:MAG: methyltransferase [Okeania sp. SIO3B5]|uniref:methyltransferase n=1 Tax=Okeania sp. SIO3B5 TaxID=2607811 RepID=UPI0014013B37|nr:methyltransferase [Okeania sp. SIO3B5]NEO52361.1 methyltransferase [Okeania sp. SIO3B5]